MRKIFILFFLLFLTGCSSPAGSQSSAPTEWGMEDMSIIEVSSQAVISYGMTRTEIEKIVGEEQGISENSVTKDDSIYPGGLFVGYRDDIAAELVLESDAYQTAKGITIGSTMQNVEKICGATEYSLGTVVVGSTSHLTQYLFDQEGNLISSKEMPEQITSSNEYYVVSFEFEENKVVRIRLCDAQFSYKRS